jgi:hypothetical protein
VVYGTEPDRRASQARLAGPAPSDRTEKGDTMRRSPLRAWLPAIAGAALVTSIGVTGLGGLTVPSSTAAVEAQPAYKYWGYYHDAGGDWEFSMVGAHEYVPKDGSVEGWRYGLDTGGERPPRTTPDFDAICGDQPADPGSKRVAVVIDYGIPEEAEGDDETPDARGGCARVPRNASGQEVLEAVADLTIGDAGIASIDGYPSAPTTETFDSAEIPASEPTIDLTQADDSAAGDTSADADAGEDDGPPWALIGVGGVAVVIAAGAIVVARRRG